MNRLRQVPVILCISGHDPSGGAGIQADAETIAALGGHACCVISAITEQDSCDVFRLIPQPPEQVLSQARRILADSPVAAIKIGLVGHEAMMSALAELLDRAPDIPVVLDPVLASGGGTNLAQGGYLKALRVSLLPRTTLATPNSEEARRLAGSTTGLDDCARQILALGCARVLITGAHEESKEVTNRLYDRTGLRDSSHWPRLDASYHGSGCTLAAGIAARLASGDDMLTAVRAAQKHTWRSLKHALKTGRCQPIPDRFFALRRPARK
jgi:hydroxymethylpyrimidine/phosphomethylpyrimidine kinase